MSLYFCFTPKEYFQFYERVLSQKENAIHPSLCFFLCPNFFLAAWPPCPFSPVTHQFPGLQHGPISLLSFHTQFCLNMGFVVSSRFPTITCTDGGSIVPPACSEKLLNMHFSTTGSQPLPERVRKSWKSISSGLHFQIAPSPLEQLCRSQLFPPCFST